MPNNFKLSKRKHLLLSGNVQSSFVQPLQLLIKKVSLISPHRRFDLTSSKGYKVHLTKTTAAKLGLKASANVLVQADERALVNLIRNREIDLSINFNMPGEDKVNYEIRRASVDFSVRFSLPPLPVCLLLTSSGSYHHEREGRLLHVRGHLALRQAPRRVLRGLLCPPELRNRRSGHLRRAVMTLVECMQ